MEYQKTTNLRDTTSDNVAIFIIKTWVEVSDQSGESQNTCKQIILKHQCWDHLYTIKVMHVFFPKELLLLQIQIVMHMIRN